MTNVDPPTLPYRPCVGIMLINRDGLVWVGHRADTPREAEGPGSWWQMPQGGIDEGEAPHAAAARELWEETGIREAEIIAETAGWLRYDLPSDLVGRAWGGRWQGQRQKWFAMRFRGADDEVNISPEPGHQIEFDAWRWVPVSALVDLVVPFKRDVYMALTRELGSLAAPE